MKTDGLALAVHFVGIEIVLANGKVDHGNIVRYGRTDAGTQRLECTICDRVFVGNKGTIFYGLHHSLKDTLEYLAILAERNSLAAIEPKLRGN